MDLKASDKLLGMLSRVPERFLVKQEFSRRTHDRGIYMDDYIVVHNYEENSPSSQFDPDCQQSYASKTILCAYLDDLNDIDELGPKHPDMQHLLTSGNLQPTADSQATITILKPWMQQIDFD